MTNKLFSYGTLQSQSVQIETFGRILNGKQDVLDGFKIELIKITDPEIIEISGKEYHPALSRSKKDSVHGMIFELSEEELEKCDKYEKDYVRIRVKTRSEIDCFVYVPRSFL